MSGKKRQERGMEALVSRKITWKQLTFVSGIRLNDDDSTLPSDLSGVSFTIFVI